MSMKSFISITILVVVLVATQAQAQINLPNIGLNSLLNISGLVSCSVNGSVNGTNPTPPFPNAQVDLVCGGSVVASTVTNASGMFSIILNQLTVVLRNLLSSCNLVVRTPLSTCNATLPSNGTLQAPLQFLNTTVLGLLNIANLGTQGPFRLV